MLSDGYVRVLRRVWNFVRFVVVQAIAANRPRTACADAPGMVPHKCVAFLAALFRQILDILVPCHHSVVGLGTEDPGMTAVHRTSLTTFKNELVRRGTRLRVRAELLIGEVQRHDWRLRVDTIR